MKAIVLVTILVSVLAGCSGEKCLDGDCLDERSAACEEHRCVVR